MYQRDEHNRLIVNNAWAIPHLPMSIIVELPDGTLRRFGVLMQDYYERHEDRPFAARLPQDDDLHPYKGYHPKTIPTALTYSPTEGAVYGLSIVSASSAASALGRKGGSATSAAKKKSSAANGKLGGRPRKAK